MPTRVTVVYSESSMIDQFYPPSHSTGAQIRKAAAGHVNAKIKENWHPLANVDGLIEADSLSVVKTSGDAGSAIIRIYSYEF
jgi:hypothetical protein